MSFHWEKRMATLEQIQVRMKKLQAQAEVLIARRAQHALDQIRELMIKHGLTTRDIEARAKAKRDRASAERLGLRIGKLKSAGATKGKLPPKYRDPKTGATWSGHARPPAWIKNVKDRTRFLIDGSGAAVDAAVSVKAKPAAKKAAGKVGRQAAAKKSAAKKSTAARTVGRKAAAKKTAVKTTAAKKAAGRKVAAKKAKVGRPATGKTARKSVAGKSTSAKTVARKAGHGTARKMAPRATSIAAPVTANGAITHS
jgi:DNA-binding protein H-NS